MTNRMNWKMADGKIMTRWAERVNPEDPLPEYPRPQMVRNDWLNLNGLWDYAVTPFEREDPGEFEGKILVPFPIESSLSGVKRGLLPDEKLWYRRTFEPKNEWKGKGLLLHFGAVDWKAEVFINHRKIGEHTGGFYPFSFDITPYIQDGENEILVCVWDPTDTYGQERGKQTLKPKGIFYTAVSGIWQTVWLEPVPETYMKSIRLTPDIDKNELAVQIETAGKIFDGVFEAVVCDGRKRLVSGTSSLTETLTLPIPDAKLWSPDSPFLYDLTIRLIKDGVIVDQIGSYFGMRKFSIERDENGIKRFCLNNRPLFQHGILDQGYWPDGLYTAPADEALLYDVQMIKKMGFNMVRKHIKVEPARWYYHCDCEGLIVWQDMINGGGGWNHLHHFILPNFFRTLKVSDHSRKALGRGDEKNRANFKKELKEMIDALYNVPSIGVWVPFNEAWGQFDAAEILEWVQHYDPTRLVDHASGWHDQEVGDIKSVHIYFRKLKMPKKIYDRAVVISEYGGYSLPVPGHRWSEKRPFGYRMYKTEEELLKAYSSLLNDQLKPLIEKGVSAAVYTQFTDVEEEVNGLLTYDRSFVKINIDDLYTLNQSIINSGRFA